MIFNPTINRNYDIIYKVLTSLNINNYEKINFRKTN